MLPSEWVNDGFRHTYNRMDGRFFDCAQNDRATNGRACEIQSTIPKIHRRTIRKTKPLHARPDCHAEEALSAVPGTGRRQADEASTAAWDHARACVTAVMRATTRVAPTTAETAPRGQDALGPRKGRGRSMTMAFPPPHQPLPALRQAQGTGSASACLSCGRRQATPPRGK